MKPKKLFPRPNIITPALQLGLTDVSENKKTKKKWKTIRRRSKKLFFVIRSVQNSFVSKRKIKKYLRR